MYPGVLRAILGPTAVTALPAALSIVCASAAVAGCASRAASAPPAATPETQPPPSPPLPRGPVDPEATNYPYPYPVQFFEVRTQAQSLRMAYMDVPAKTRAAAAAGAPESSVPASNPMPAASATQPSAATDAAAPTAQTAQAPAPAPSASQPPSAASGSATMPASAAAPGARAASASAAVGYGDELEPKTEPTPAPTTKAPTAPIASATSANQPQVTGRCVLLLHGKNFTAANWGPTIDFLTRQGFRVIAPDQIGFGKSSKPGAYQYSFAQLAHNTRGLLESLQLSRCSVVGHSMGGMVAVRFALLYPAATERLILVNPLGLEDYSVSVPYRTIDEWFRDELQQTPETIREYQRASYYAGAWRPEYEAQIQQVAGFTLHPDYPRVAWANALTYDMIFTQPVVTEFPRIRVPTRLIIGTRDRTAPGRKFALPQSGAAMGNFAMLGKRARDTIPGAQLVELPSVGHVPQVEAFDQFSDALLRFLR
jgi:pimeloyl-ACP methyl ester carboxylesterase